MRRLVIFCLAVTMSVTMAGCSKKDSKDTSKEDTGETTVLDDNNDGFSDEAYGNVELGEYKGISVDKYIYEVTEDDIDTEVDYILSEYEEYNEVDRESKIEDYVTVYMTAKSNGEIIYDFSKESEEDEGYEILVGYYEFGEAFDEKLTGVKAGDKLQFSEEFDKDFEDDNLAGKKVDFDIEVVKVTEVNTPVLTEDFAKNEMGYDSIAQLREEAKKNIEETNENNSIAEMEDTLLQKVINTSKVEGYSEELLKICKEDIEASYEEAAPMWGASSLQEFYEMYGVTQEDIEKEALNQLYGRAIVRKIAELENIEVTETDYKKFVKQYTEEDGYSDESEFEEEYGKDAINHMILQQKVLDLIKDNANITEVPAPEGEEE